MHEPTPRFEEIEIPLTEPVHGLETVSAVLGVPGWWPTGSRVAVAIAHGSASDLKDPLVQALQEHLTEQKFLTLRFNFPFAESGKRSSTDSMSVLERTYLSAISLLGRDPTSAPAHLFIGGIGLGARVAAQVATTRVQVDGLFFLAFPLHPQDKPGQSYAQSLYRIIAPMLFIQGTRDRQCDLGMLRNTLVRVGAPTTLHVSDGADKNFKVPKKSPRTPEMVRDEVLATVTTWFEKILNGS